MARATVGRARELRKTMTRYEVKLWLRLRALNKQGFHFRRQAPLDRWVADFACFANRVIVEVDGSQHGFEDHMVKDAVRDLHFKQTGFVTLRFTNSDVWENIEGVMDTIFSHRKMVSALLSETNT
jgi:very-short-patch-repair endonuclease